MFLLIETEVSPIVTIKNSNVFGKTEDGNWGSAGVENAEMLFTSPIKVSLAESEDEILNLLSNKDVPEEEPSEETPIE